MVVELIRLQFFPPPRRFWHSQPLLFPFPFFNFNFFIKLQICQQFEENPFQLEPTNIDHYGVTIYFSIYTKADTQASFWLVM